MLGSGTTQTSANRIAISFPITPVTAMGLYYHTAFYGGGGGTGNQLTELIPLDRMFSQV